MPWMMANPQYWAHCPVPVDQLWRETYTSLQPSAPTWCRTVGASPMPSAFTALPVSRLSVEFLEFVYRPVLAANGKTAMIRLNSYVATLINEAVALLPGW